MSIIPAILEAEAGESKFNTSLGYITRHLKNVFKEASEMIQWVNALAAKSDKV